MGVVKDFFWGVDNKSPDFEKGVGVILATFTVFTGFTINQFLAKVKLGDYTDWRWWAFFALVALLLRYIFGSAIHLNGTYVGKTKYKKDPEASANVGAAEGLAPEHDKPKSSSVLFLFKDLLFLVLFGMLAIFILDANDIEEFAYRAMLFVGAGFAWSVLDYLARRVWCFWVGEDRNSWQLHVVDAGFIALFVYLILCASHATNIVDFVPRFAWIVIAGFVFVLANWAVVTRWPAPANANASEWPGPFWRLWAVFDGVQFLLTWGVVKCVPHAHLPRVIAILFVTFLFFDLLAMVRAIQLDLK